RPASANRSGAAARMEAAMASMLSWRVWSATLVRATSPSAANCGAHSAFVHSSPGTSTRLVAAAAMSHSPFFRLDRRNLRPSRTDVHDEGNATAPAAQGLSGAQQAQERDICATQRKCLAAMPLFLADLLAFADELCD